jgi:hypothetical protein
VAYSNKEASARIAFGDNAAVAACLSVFHEKPWSEERSILENLSFP